MLFGRNSTRSVERSRTSLFAGLACTLAALLLVLVAPIHTMAAQGQDLEGSPGGPLEIKVIGDKILARVELQTEVWFKDTHVIVDYNMPYAMMIQSCVYGNVRFGEGETTMRILNNDFRVEVPRDQIVPEIGAVCGELTGKYDKHLDQVDIVAIVGWPLLRQFGLTLDIQAGSMVLHPEGELSAEEVRANSVAFVDGVELIGSSVFIPVNYNGGQSAFMKVSTSGYHTVLNRELLDDRKAGVIDEAYFGFDESMKISDMAALYPQDVYTQWWDAYAAAKAEQKRLEEEDPRVVGQIVVTQPDQPSSDVLLVSGLSVLSGYRIVLDQNQGFVGLSRTLNSNYSDADHQFYMAAAARDEDALYEYLEENPTDRNVEEAVADFVNLGLESGASIDRLVSAVDFGLGVNEERRKFTYLADFVFDMWGNVESRDQFSPVIVVLGEKAMGYIERSDTPKDRQKVQGILGDRYLARNDAETAWKYFLSAAFNGDPELDAITRFDLGRVYEALGRDSRAYANYTRALSAGGLPPESVEIATQAKERLRLRLDPNDDALRTDAQGG